MFIFTFIGVLCVLCFGLALLISLSCCVYNSYQTKKCDNSMKYLITLIRPSTGSKITIKGRTMLSSFCLGEEICEQFPEWLVEDCSLQYN